MSTLFNEVIEQGGTFEEFVWKCATCFAPVAYPPDAGEIRAKKAVEEALAQIAKLMRMDLVAIRKAAAEAHASVHANWVEDEERQRNLRARYDDMRAKISAWIPPTPEHACLKEFMLEQAHFNPWRWPEPVAPDSVGWWESRFNEAIETFEREAHAWCAARAETRKRLAWVAALRASVPEPTKGGA